MQSCGKQPKCILQEVAPPNNEYYAAGLSERDGKIFVHWCLKRKESFEAKQSEVKK